MLGRVDIHYFDQSRTADHGIQFFAVNLQVVAQVAQFLDYARVPFGVDVFCVDARFVVEIVERGLVAALIAFVQQEESFHRTGGLSSPPPEPDEGVPVSSFRQELRLQTAALSSKSSSDFVKCFFIT